MKFAPRKQCGAMEILYRPDKTINPLPLTRVAFG